MPERGKGRKDGDEDEARGRAFWTGALSFGLVNIPVGLYPAVHHGRAALRLLDEDGTPLARRFYCPEGSEDVPPEHLVRGFETEDGEYVAVTDEELRALDPEKSREIALKLFVDRADVDPVYFERPYVLAPEGESGKAYALLASVMDRTHRAGIATFVMRDREYLVAIYAEDGVLRAETLRFHDEVRSIRDVGLPAFKKPPRSAAKRFESAIASLRAPRLPTADLSDAQADALVSLAEKKRERGLDVVHSDVATAPTEGPSPTVLDLMERLRKSVGRPAKTRPARRAPRRTKARRP